MVRVACPETAPTVAVTWAMPGLRATMRPFSTLARSEPSTLHVARPVVTSDALPLEKSAVATNCSLAPGGNVTDGGETFTETSVTVAAPPAPPSAFPPEAPPAPVELPLVKVPAVDPTATPVLGPVDPVLNPVATIPVPTLVAVAPVVSPDVDVDPDDPVEDPVLVDDPVCSR